MRAPRLGVTLMAHCVLPTAGATQGEVPLADVPKYVDAAIEGMLGELARRGARPGELEIKLFGGADQTIGGVTPRYGVGIRNAEMALDVLTGHGITPRATDLGGRRGRVVEFETATGAAFVRQLPAAFGARAGEKR